mgnify:CR=1 FL=1
MDKVLVFIDLDNIYRGLVEHFGIEPIEGEFNIFNELRRIQKEKDNEVYEIYAFGDFDKLGSSSFKTKLAMEGIQTIDVFSTNGSINRKNASDIQLSIDAVDCAFTIPEIKKYLFVSADSDMISIINYLKGSKHRKRVALYVLGKQANVSVLKNFPNDGFALLEDIIKLKEPIDISEEVIVRNLELFVHRILITEQYNLKNGRKRIYYTLDGYRWNEMRFLKLEGSRLCGKHIDQIITYMKKQNIIDIIYNSEIGLQEIVLNREHELVKKVLEKFID